MHVMDEAEYRRFLTKGTRTEKLATTRADVILISTHAEQDYTDLIAASPVVGFLPKSALSADAIAT